MIFGNIRMLIIVNGLYDLACAASILEILHPTILSTLHTNMYILDSEYFDHDDGNELDCVAKRHLAYWIATYGLMRYCGSQQMARLSYLVEACGFLMEYKAGRLNERGVYVIWVSLLIYVWLFF